MNTDNVKFNLDDHSHRRLNILTGEWVLVSPHRAKRPWNGKIEKLNVVEKPQYDSQCQLCPTNTRANGDKNPDYKETFVFQNDFSALLSDSPEGEINIDDMLVAKSERGICRVINFSPNHKLTLAEMSIDDICKVVDLWANQYDELSQIDWINHIQIFENKGDLMGNSNPHPHGQIWSQSSIPMEAYKKTISQKNYFEKKKTSLLGDYLKLELKINERIISQNEHFAVLVPFWAVWPFETMIIPKRHVATVSQLSKQERRAFAEMIKLITVKYDNMFECSFPYSSGISQAPTDKQYSQFWHMHLSFYPPLLRSATIKKFMVGYELFANPQRDITAEIAAKKLRELPEIHYKSR